MTRLLANTPLCMRLWSAFWLVLLLLVLVAWVIVPGDVVVLVHFSNLPIYWFSAVVIIVYVWSVPVTFLLMRSWYRLLAALGVVLIGVVVLTLLGPIMLPSSHTLCGDSRCYYLTPSPSTICTLACATEFYLWQCEVGNMFCRKTAADAYISSEYGDTDFLINTVDMSINDHSQIVITQGDEVIYTYDPNAR